MPHARLAGHQPLRRKEIVMAHETMPPEMRSTGASGATPPESGSTGAAQPFRLTGEEARTGFQEWLNELTIRRILIKDAESRTVVELPLVVGILLAVLLPVWMVLGVILALALRYTIEIIRRD
jgi:hypothetical protein